MTDNSKTATDHSIAAAVSTQASEPVLVVAHHPDPAKTGQRLQLREGKPVVLGRGAAYFSTGTFDDSRLSRRHLQIERTAAGVLARDLGSHNGSYLNGDAFDAGPLTEGDVLGIGPVLLLHTVGPSFVRPSNHAYLIGIGHALADLLEQIDQVAGHGATTVLIEGETGVGKELVARAIHDASERSGEFVAINCGAVTDGVATSELFGHMRGAFSGATEDRGGLVAAAAGGTLLLDEVGDASAALQVALLRLLEGREYRAVGSDVTLTTDARFVAATHVPLAEAVALGRFRPDLLNRLDRWVIQVLPLRERREDIMPLARHFAAGRAIGRRLAIALLRHAWPGNIRELQSVIEQALVAQPPGEALQLTERVAKRLAVPEPAAASAPVRSERPDAATLRRRFLALGGNINTLAKELGVGRNTLYRWFKDAGLDPQILRGEL